MADIPSAQLRGPELDETILAKAIPFLAGRKRERERTRGRRAEEEGACWSNVSGWRF